ncbi:MAG: DegV family protein, partial [Oscillospiraceae bacterium]|nr:DegV family protein [Oscillospiraceae bacterium]
MADYILSCCSTADLTQEHFDAKDIHYICFHYTLGGVDYDDDLGKSMPFDEFYKAMAEGKDTKTSQINVDEFEAYFTPFLEEGKDILHVTLSSGISGVNNSANVAAEILRAKYPERKIYIVDSLAASSGYGLIMDKLAGLRDGGMSIDEAYRWIEANKKRLHHWFFTTDLTYFVKGGRVSKVSGWFGTVLKICPLLNVDYKGKLIPRSKVRGKAKVIEEVVAVGVGMEGVGDALLEAELALEAFLDGGGQGEAAVVGLDGAAGDDGVGTFGNGIGHQEFQLAGLVA